jgi:tetratricopeptide (TPR) repeat protein
MIPRLAVAIALVALAGCRSAVVPTDPSVATTDEKIEMLSEALAARDRGDNAEALRQLDRLLLVAPSDPTVLRLQREVRQAQATPPSAASVVVSAPIASAPIVQPVQPALFPSQPTPQVQAPAAAQPVVPAPPPVTLAPAPLPAPGSAPTNGSSIMPPVIEEFPPGAAPQPPDELALALRSVEAAGAAFAQAPGGVERLMTYLEAQRTLAQIYSDRGQHQIAAQTITRMLESLESYRDLLKDEREQYIREEVEARQGPRLLRRR